MKTETAAKRDLTRTRRWILDAAAREFADKGVAGARVDAIARRARVNKAMIYYIFRSKDGLHLAVLEDLFEEKTKNLGPEFNRPAPTMKGVSALLAGYFDALRDRREYARIMLDDLATGAHQLRRLKRRRPDLFRFYADTVALIKRLSAAGGLPPLDPDRAVIALILLLVSLAAASPHLDLVAGPDPPSLKTLADPQRWKLFFAELLSRLSSGGGRPRRKRLPPGRVKDARPP